MKKSDKMHPNFKRTLIVTTILCLLTIIIVAIVQIYGQKSLTGCSYLDPVTIDLLAFLAAVFLVVEGFVRIFEHKTATLKRQFTRIVRIMFGCAILTLHVMQFMHK